MKLHYKHTLYASYLGYITQAIINNLAPLLFLTFQKSFDISLEKIGLLVSINFGTQMVVDFLAAKYIDKIGYRIPIVTAHIMSTLGLIGLGIFPFIFPNAYAGLICAIMLNAIGGGLIEVLVSPIVEALPGDEKASAMSLLHSFYCWGHVAVVILSTCYFSIVGISKWYYLPLIWAIVPLLNTFFFLGVPLLPLVAEDMSLPIKKLFSLKIFWLFFALMICAGASEQAMSQWASLFAESGLQVSKTMGDLLGPCTFAILMGVSRVFYGKFGHKIDLKLFIRLSSILCIFSYLLATLSPIPLLSLIGCSLCGLSVGIMWPGTFSLATKHCPQGGTAMFAMFALAGDIGCGSGPGLVGIISSLTASLKMGLLVAIVFPIAMFLFVCTLKKLKEPDSNMDTVIETT